MADLTHPPTASVSFVQIRPNGASLLAQALINWASRNGRRPPWRASADLYELAVAEILLQKTKAGDVEPVWLHLIDAYATASELADASSDTVRDIVKCLGLGRQRTARLLAVARALVTTGLEAATGIGPYGRAILALSANARPEGPPVDGNMARVITRLLGLKFERGEARKKPEVKRAVEELLASCRRRPEKLALVYAMVDLGQAVCRPAHPNCAACPLLPRCAYAALCSVGQFKIGDDHLHLTTYIRGSTAPLRRVAEVREVYGGAVADVLNEQGER